MSNYSTMDTLPQQITALSTILNNLDELVLIFQISKDTTKLEYANRSFFSLTGFSKSDLLKSLETLFPVDEYEVLHEAINTCKEGTSEIIIPGGELENLIYSKITCIALPSATKKCSKVVCIVLPRIETTEDESKLLATSTQFASK